MLKLSLIAFLVLCFCHATDLMAPEITEQDVFGFESYRIEENGAICDKEGTIRGWIRDNTVYDAHWNIKYHIQKDRHYRAAVEEPGV